MDKRLDKERWIDAALRELAAEGVAAVKVERLAAKLEVTKGSFYWHFKDRSALLEAMLETWRRRATHTIIDEVEAKGGNATERLSTLFTIVSKLDGHIDRSIRAWAAHDGAARRSLDEIDLRRLDYLTGLFREMSFGEAEALARARLVYHALIGQFAMGEKTGHADRLAECLEIVHPMLVRR
jgi:AcrR family transcriptional regulator